VPPSPTPHVECNYWYEGWGYTFEIYSIEDWGDDDGFGLKKQEDGCGDVTGWSWTDATSADDPYVYFNIDLFIKPGCIERAIVSAGGPKISCDYKGEQGNFKLKMRDGDGDGDGLSPSGGPGLPPYFTEEQTAALESHYGITTNFAPYVPMNWTNSSLSTMTSISTDTNLVHPISTSTSKELRSGTSFVYIYVYEPAEASVPASI
jgi:hypothetical protein